jgi:hypothetical protein
MIKKHEASSWPKSRTSSGRTRRGTRSPGAPKLVRDGNCKAERWRGIPSRSSGDKVYWDNTNKEATEIATANTLIGGATEAVAGGAGDLIGPVRLNASF